MSKFPALAGESQFKAQFQCSICREVFTDPVTIPCGRSFCKSCITERWDESQRYDCPSCKEKFTNRPELKINTNLEKKCRTQRADFFKRKTVSHQSQVLCDACQQRAIKSCLDCGVTFCMSHLEPHVTVPNYKNHKLLNAVENLEKYRCQKHERPLELFCREDQTSVCVFCAETEHKNHRVIPLEEESGPRKSQLGKTQTKLEQMIQERLMKIQEINHSVELSKRNTEKEKSDSVEVFTALIRSIERSQAELLKVMEEKQKAAEKQVEGLIKELEQEIHELKRRNTELEQLSHTDDHLHLLQIYPSLCSAPRTKNWTEIRINTKLNSNALRPTLSQLQKTLNEKLSRTLNEKMKEMASSELKRIQQYAVDVTLDPDTAHPNLILSADGKQVTYGNTIQNLPDSPKRFTCYEIVLGNQGFSSGRFYYEVQVSGKTKWELGVVKESVNRKGKIENCNNQGGFWFVALRNESNYEAWEDTNIPLSLGEKPQKVGVFVDYEKGLVSFYDVEARSHIYSFTGQSFTEKLYPYFDPWPNDGGKNSAPLIISRVIKTE